MIIKKFLSTQTLKINILMNKLIQEKESKNLQSIYNDINVIKFKLYEYIAILRLKVSKRNEKTYRTKQYKINIIDRKY